MGAIAIWKRNGMTKEEYINLLYQRLVVEGKSAVEVAKEVGASAPEVIMNQAKKFGIREKKVPLWEQRGMTKESFLEMLRRMYWEEEKSFNDIAKELDMKLRYVRTLFERYHIPHRSREEGTQLAKEQGKYQWERTSDGYIHPSTGYFMVYQPEHPYANKNGYIGYHRIVAEEKFGGPIPTDIYDVHHINEDRSDNRLTNLAIVRRELHMRFHSFKLNKERMMRKKGKIDYEELRSLVKKRLNQTLAYQCKGVKRYIKKHKKSQDAATSHDSWSTHNSANQ